MNVKGGLISDYFYADSNRAQDSDISSDLAHCLGDSNQSEIFSEVKPPLTIYLNI